MPLLVEVQNPRNIDEWRPIETIKPGDLPGSLSDNPPEGGQHAYLFACLEDNSKSVLYRADSVPDIAIGPFRVMVDEGGFELVRELDLGVPYEITVRINSNPTTTRHIRFTHV